MSANPKALDLIMSFTLASVVFNSYKIGLLDSFFNAEASKRTLDLNQFLLESKANERIVRGMVEFLERRDFLMEDPIQLSKYKLGKLGEELVQDGWISYVLFYIGGYGNLVFNSDRLADESLKYGADITRNIDWVAKGTEMMSHTKHHLSYEAVIKTAQKLNPQKVLDIGCGTGNFLLQVKSACDSKHAVGIDVSERACEIAKKTIKKNDGRVDIVEGDFIDKASFLIEKYSGFDVITAMMIIHEYLLQGDEKVIECLKVIKSLIAENGTLILLDKATNSLEEAPPYFTEYKFVHDLSYQNLCSIEHWRELIKKAGMEIKFETFLPKHTGTVLIEIVRRK